MSKQELHDYLAAFPRLTPERPVGYQWGNENDPRFCEVVTDQVADLPCKVLQDNHDGYGLAYPIRGDHLADIRKLGGRR